MNISLRTHGSTAPDLWMSRIPAAVAPQVRVGRERAPTVARERASVLLISGDVLTRLVLARSLQEAGLRVIPVAHTAEALSVLEAVPGIRTVITDAAFSSGDLSGLQLARQISDRWKARVVIAGKEALEPSELPTGAYFIATPVHGATLTHLVQHLSSLPDAPEIQPAERVPAAQPTKAAVPSVQATARNRGSRDELTLRQKEILALLMQGQSTREMAHSLGVSVNTVRVHLLHLFRALGVNSRTQAILVGLKHVETASRLS